MLKKKIVNVKLNILLLSIEEPTILSKVWEFTQTNTFLSVKYDIFHDPLVGSVTVGVCVILWYLYLRYTIRGKIEFERLLEIKRLKMNSEGEKKNEIFNFIELLKMYKIEMAQCKNVQEELLINKKYSILFNDEKFSSILKDENYSIFLKDIKIDIIQKDIKIDIIQKDINNIDE